MFERSLLLPYSGSKNTSPNCEWIYLPAWRHILADLNFHEHCSESLKSYIYYCCSHICSEAVKSVGNVKTATRCYIWGYCTLYHFVTFHSSVSSSTGAINISSWKTVITLYKYFRCIMNVSAAVALGTTSKNWKRRKWVGNRLWNILISCYQIWNVLTWSS